MNERILVLESDPSLADGLAALLAADNYAVEVVGTAARGLAKVPDRWAAVVLDRQLPDLPGHVVREVIADLGPVPVLLISVPGANIEAELLRTGATAVVRRPFSAQAVRELLRWQLQAGAPESWPKDVVGLSPDDLEHIAHMSNDELNQLPYGLIRIDRAGIIRGFSPYEAHAAGMTAARVVGKPFAQIAPCTQVAELVVGLEEGFQRGSLDLVLRFVFPRFGGVSLVSVRLFCARPAQECWVFVSPRQ